MKWFYGLLFLLTLVLVAVMTVALANPAFRASIADVDVARGMITFMIATLAIGVVTAIIVSLMVFEKDDLPRLDTAKDVLSSLFAILGTIMGFYYGASTSGDKNSTAETIPPLQVAQGLGASGVILLTASGTRGPYILEARAAPSGPSILTPDAVDPNRFHLTQTAFKGCPAGLAVTSWDIARITAPSTSITLTREALAKAGWRACAESGPS